MPVNDLHAIPGAVRIRELPVGDTQLAHQAMRELRPAHPDQQQFSDYVDDVLRPAGYRLVGAFAADHDAAVAVAGFRRGDSLAWGHHIYVDDLSTVPDSRRHGYAGALLDWLVDEARTLGCTQLHLDSGTGAERFPLTGSITRTGWRSTNTTSRAACRRDRHGACVRIPSPGHRGAEANMLGFAKMTKCLVHGPVKTSFTRSRTATGAC